MKKMQLIQVTPEEFQEAIINGVKEELLILKKEFKVKESDELMSRQEVAKHFKANETTIWRWEKQGYLKSYGIGNRVYYKRSEIESSMLAIDNNSNHSHAS